jgi:hypothetical protein
MRRVVQRAHAETRLARSQNAKISARARFSVLARPPPERAQTRPPPLNVLEKRPLALTPHAHGSLRSAGSPETQRHATTRTRARRAHASTPHGPASVLRGLRRTARLYVAPHGTAQRVPASRHARFSATSASVRAGAGRGRGSSGALPLRVWCLRGTLRTSRGEISRHLAEGARFRSRRRRAQRASRRWSSCSRPS